MLAYFRQVEAEGEVLIVTDHRRPVLKIERLASVGTLADVFRDCRGGVRATDQALLAPETEDWEDA